ncbi:hypothetical protein dsmv_3195 [Desulfococcus multivorans DSM 2059]|jgi:hypothetical protein|uniref:Uncharacterized protein n=1 Tax=Desulfococcus multivorans DSM 2059 TaxID=1121405 RepID=S7TDR5_DESML|nr:hypothetical protein dsmv_3195 [Desulfococcus multivorans DSM 2059]SJZ95986.1 hypothetical protein SAMN02745446_02205 [Desulfococcus multivorans DSM 2059]
MDPEGVNDFRGATVLHKQVDIIMMRFQDLMSEAAECLGR